jgi:hypothetical protein
VSRASRKRHAVIEAGYGLTQCVGKQTYKTEWSARRAAKKHGQRYYECEVCRWWHLTSSAWGRSP